jgi:hypothetical protein
MRTSVNDPLTPETATAGAGDISDFQAVDDTPSVWSSLFSFLWKLLWVVIGIVTIMTVTFPYLFPQWADEYQNTLKELRIAADTPKFLKNAKSVDWKEAFTRTNFDNLRYVGTGLHPQFRANPGLKPTTWYTGQVFIMKRYVTTRDWLVYTKSNFESDAVNIDEPMTDIDQADAAEYCRNQGGRLPTWRELDLAYYFKFTRKWQGKTGRILKPNLVFNITPEYSLWTGSAQGDGYYESDNFRIFNPGLKEPIYYDDGHEAENLGFLCVKDEIRKK